MNDAAWAARRLWRDLYHGRVRQLLRDASHGRYLVSLGFESDLDLCARMDAIPIVPSVKEGRIGAPARPG
jgi:phosphosulfolactate phosphohydrolase-like enzyme